MPWTDDEMQSLMGATPSTPAPLSGLPDLSWGESLEKRGKQLVNVVPQTASDMFQDVVGVYGAARPDQVSQSDIEAAGHALPTFDVGPTKGIADVALNNVVPQIASWALPYGEISKGAKLLGLGGVAAEGLAQGGANLLTSAGEGTQGNPVNSGILGASSGIVQAALPRWQRALPLAAISALDYAHTGNAWEAGGNFIGNMLPGAFKASDVTAATLSPNSLNDVSEAIGLKPQSSESPIQAPLTPITPELSGLQAAPDQSQPLAPLAQGNGGLPPPSPDTSGMKLSQFNLAPTKAAPDFSPSGLQLADQPTAPQSSGIQLDRSGNPLLPPVESADVGNSGLNLQGQVPQQTEMPLVALQGKGLDPNTPNFQLIDHPEVPQSPSENLFNWRNDAVNTPPAHPLLEWHPPVAEDIQAPSLSTIPAKGSAQDLSNVLGGMKIVANDLQDHIQGSLANIGEFGKNLVDQTVGTVKMGDLGGDIFDNPEMKKYKELLAASEAKTTAIKIQDIWDDKSPTTPIQGTPQEVQAIRDAYQGQVQKTGFPDANISDVLADSKIDPERGKGIIADLYNKGEVNQLSKGDWVSATEDKKMGGMRVPSSDEAPELQMKMKPISSSVESIKKDLQTRPVVLRPQDQAGGYTLVHMKAENLDSAWAKDTDNYIPKGGGGAEIYGRRQGMLDWMNKNQNKPIQAGTATVDSDGTLTFDNGRHRTSLMRDAGREDIPIAISEGSLKNAKNNRLISSSVESEPPMVMKPNGDLLNPTPTQVGPHIISTVLDEGDGQLLAGNNWNDPHQKGDNSIFTQHIDNATGLGKSGFVIQDTEGNIRTTTDRVEAGQIADQAGQRTPETIGTPLQSEDLINKPSQPVDPVTPQQAIQNETINTQTENGNIEQTLRQNLATAKSNNDGIGIRIAARKLQDFLVASKPIEAAERELAATKLATSEVDIGSELKGKQAKLAKNPERLIQSQRMIRGKGSTSGQISPETAAVLALGGIGALVAYQQTKGDVGSTIAAGVIAAGLGFAGVKAIKALRESVGPEAKILSTPLANAGLKARLDQFATNTMRTPGGMAVFGRGGISANAIRAAEGLAGLNGSPLFRDAKLLADGYIAHQLEVMTDALEQARPYKPSQAFQDASAQFIRGQLADPVQVEALIRGGGGVDAATFEGLSPKDKLAYPEKWITTNDLANTSGDATEVYRVTNSAKSTLNQMQQNALSSLVSTPDDREFMKFMLQSRESIDNIMQVVHDALPPGLQRNKVLGTMGQYVSRSHAILTDPKYYPTENEIQGAMDRLGKIKEDRFLKANSTAPGTPGTIPVQYNGNTYNLSSADKDAFDNLHTPESLRSLVSQYIQQIKQTAAGKSQGLVSSDTAQLGTSLFAGRKQLDEVTQALLGTHEAPLEMVQNTLNKLIPTARASHFMSSLITMADERTGLSHAYTSEIEYNRAVNDIKSNLRSQVLTPVERQANQTKLQELSSYVPISGSDSKFGIFQGSYVSRMANDQLAGYNGPFGILDNTIGKGLSQFNQLVKDTHLVLNPITQVRNIMQIPMFLAMGNAAAHPAEWKSAIEAMNNPLSPVGRRLTLNGVFAGNPVHGEFKEGIQKLLSGDTDRSIWNILKKGKGMAENLYAMPDNFVRASVYLAEEGRAAKKFGVSVDDLDPRVMAQARQFMSRRTLDYANVPTWVKAGRQIPFVSMYLSYTHEIMRVASNMAIDAVHGDLGAGATLAGIASTPFLLQNMAENRLSPVDKQAWDKANAVSAPYSRYRFKLPINRNANGSFNYLDITPLSHFSDFQMMARAGIKKDWSAIGAVNPLVGTDNTPLLSLLSEQITGQDAHTGRVYRNPADRALAIAREIVPPHTPGIGYEYIKDMPEALGGDLGVTNLKNGRTNTIAGTISRHLTGVDYTQVDPGLAEKSYVAGAQEQIANERQYLMDTLKTQGLSDEAKKRATDRFVGAVHHITEQMQTRLNLIPSK